MRTTRPLRCERSLRWKDERWWDLNTCDRAFLDALRSAIVPVKRRAGSTGRCNTGLQFTRRSFKAQGFSRALIEAQSYLVEIA